MPAPAPRSPFDQKGNTRSLPPTATPTSRPSLILSSDQQNLQERVRALENIILSSGGGVALGRPSSGQFQYSPTDLSTQGLWNTVHGDASTDKSPAHTVDGMGSIPPQEKENLSFFGKPEPSTDSKASDHPRAFFEYHFHKDHHQSHRLGQPRAQRRCADGKQRSRSRISQCRQFTSSHTESPRQARERRL